MSHLVRLSVVLGVIALAPVLPSGAATSSTVQVISFDDQPGDVRLTDEYAERGIRFVEFEDATLPAVLSLPAQASSGDNVAAIGESAETQRHRVQGIFAAPTDFVTVNLGGYGRDPEPTQVTLIALGEHGQVVARSQADVLPDLPFDRQSLTATSEAGDIRSFVLEAAGPEVAFDDLSFRSQAPPPPDFSLVWEGRVNGSEEIVGEAGLRRGFETRTGIVIERKGSSGAIDFWVEGLPPGVSASFTLDPSDTDATTLLLTADPAAPPRETTITVVGRPLVAAAGTTDRRVSIPIVVLPNYAARPVTLDVKSCAVAEAVTEIYAPEPARAPLSFTGSVGLAIEPPGLPPGVRVDFDPPVVEMRRQGGPLPAVPFTVRATGEAVNLERETVVRIRAQAAGHEPAFADLRLRPVAGSGACPSPSLLGADGDIDGDAISDDAERNGVQVGDRFLDLPAMGADPRHKDLFVEFDAMAPHDLSPLALARVVGAFEKAPVSNPDGVPGVTVHIDHGPDSVMNPRTGAKWGNLSRFTRVPHRDMLGTAGTTMAAFDAIKSTSFAPERVGYFRYALAAHAYPSTPPGSGGLADHRGFIVSLGTNDGGTDRNWGGVTGQAAMFMHELGHTLGLAHGGGDELNYKPNYLSVMNYTWNLSGLIEPDASRPDGLRKSVLDFSRFRPGPAGLASIDEAALDPAAGLPSGHPDAKRFLAGWACGPNQPLRTAFVGAPTIEWGCPGGRRADLNQDGALSQLHSFDDWDHIRFAGGGVGGQGAGADAAVAVPETVPVRVLQKTAARLLGDGRKPRVKIAVRRRRGRAKLKVVATDARGLDSLIVVIGRRRIELVKPGSRRLAVTRRLSRGRHLVRAVATDAAGNARVHRLLTHSGSG